MIAINIDKAKAIALKLASKVNDKDKRSAHAERIGNATSAAELAAVIEQIKADTPTPAEPV